MLVSWWPAWPPLYPGQGPGDSTAVIPRTLLVKRTAAAVTSLGTVLAGGSTKAGQEVAGGVSRTLSLQGGPGLQENGFRSQLAIWLGVCCAASCTVIIIF